VVNNGLRVSDDIGVFLAPCRIQERGETGLDKRGEGDIGESDAFADKVCAGREVFLKNVNAWLGFLAEIVIDLFRIITTTSSSVGKNGRTGLLYGCIIPLRR
jgi:hypothetical protein